MQSVYASKLTKEKIWPDFSAHFRSPFTAASYESDIREVMEYFKRDFWKVREAEVETYFRWMEHKVEQGILSGAQWPRSSGSCIPSRNLPVRTGSGTGWGRGIRITISLI